MERSAYEREWIAWRQAGDRPGDDTQIVRVDTPSGRLQYVAYPYEPSTRDTRFLGHGGDLFVFVVYGDQVLISNNVFPPATIPVRLYGELPTNAEWLTCTCNRWQQIGYQMGGPPLPIAAQPCRRCRLVAEFDPAVPQ